MENKFIEREQVSALIKDGDTVGLIGGGGGLVAVLHRGDVEVAELGNTQPIQQNIRWLDVTVQNVCPVSGFDGIDNRSDAGTP